MIKVLLVSVLWLTAGNIYADFTDTEIALAQNAGEAEDYSTSTASSAQSEAAEKERRRADSIDRITRFMDMGTTANIEAMIERHITAFPDDPAAYGQLARIIMKLGSTSNDTLLGFQFSKEADRRATEALFKSLTLDPNSAIERSRLGYLHAVQGRYEDASIAFKKVRQLEETSYWLNYNEAILYIGLNQFAKAAASLQPVTSKRPTTKSNLAWNIYRSAWTLRTALALEHPDTDPVPAVARGAMTRISMSSLYDEAVNASSVDKPTIIFFESGDSGCKPCVTELAKLDEIADELGDLYELQYASVEPWNDIDKQSIAVRAFNISGVPNHIMMYKGQHLHTVPGGFSLDKMQNYKDAQPLIISGEHKTKKVKSYNEVMKLDIDYKVKAAIAKKNNFSAAAVAIDGRRWTSGISGGHDTQTQANDAAMARCESNAKARDVNARCRAYSVTQ